MKQKPKIFGGHKLRQRWFNVNDPLEAQQRRAVMEMIQHADRIEVMSTSSLASIVFSVRVNDDNHCPFETIPNPADPGARSEIVHRILVKVGLITSNGPQYVDVPRWKNKYRGSDNFQVTHPNEFALEVATQRQVYRDTVVSISQHGRVSLFEPVCPNIFAHFRGDNRADVDFFQLFRNSLGTRFVPRPNSNRRDPDPDSVGPHANDTEALRQLLRLGGGGHDTHLSAIVMELAEGAVTIHDRIATNRGGVDNRELINLWHFQLTRMSETGVMHMDAHEWNVLCTPGNPEKMQIIDFGRVARSERGIIARHGRVNITRPLNPAIYARLRDAQHNRATLLLQGIMNLPGNRYDAGVLMFGILCAVRSGGGRMNRSELAERVRDWYQTSQGVQRTPVRDRDQLVRLLEEGQRPAPEPRQRPAPEPRQRPVDRQPTGFRQLDINAITEVNGLDRNVITQVQQPNIPNADQLRAAEEQRLRLEEERRRAAEAEEERRRAAEAEAQRLREEERLRVETERRRAEEEGRLRDELERLRAAELERLRVEREAERKAAEEERLRLAAEAKRNKDAKSQAKFDSDQKAQVETWYRTKAREAAAAREAENDMKAAEAARLEREARKAQERANNGEILLYQRNLGEQRQYIYNIMNSMSNGRGRPADLPTEEWVGFFNNFSYYNGPLGLGYYRAPGRVFINDDDRQIRKRYTHQLRVIDGEYIDYGEYTRDPREVEGIRLHMDEYDRVRLLFYMNAQDAPLAFIPYDNNLGELDAEYEFRANGGRGPGYYRINPEGAEFVTFELFSSGRFGPGLYIKPHPPPPPPDGLVVSLAKGIVNLFSFGGIGKLNGGSAIVKSKRSPASKLKITEKTDVLEVGLILKDALNKDDKHYAILIMAQSLGVDTTINTKFKLSDEVLLYMAHTIMFAFSPIKYDTYEMPLITENRMDNSKINILTIKDSPKYSRKNKSPKRSVTAKKLIIT